jgi:hypothetical protein
MVDSVFEQGGQVEVHLRRIEQPPLLCLTWVNITCKLVR